jgi:D-alanine transaminase/branched-chain amino acid aminotransferase
MKEPFVFINGDFIPASRATILVSDLAVQRGYGIFDFMKTVDHMPVFYDEHLERFLNSAYQLRLDAGMDKEGLYTIIKKLIEVNNISLSGIKLTLTGGYSPDGYTLSKPNLIITQNPIQLPLPDVYEKGIRLVSYPHVRQMPDVKTIDYLMAVWLQPYIQERNADDVLYQRDGFVSECPRSNFFIVTKEGTLVTPAEHILKGVIRGKVLELAAPQFKVEERSLSLSEIFNAREAFITSTTKHALPVVELDGRVIGEGRPGKVSAWINEALLHGITLSR